jgi:hypothetical protein
MEKKASLVEELRSLAVGKKGRSDTARLGDYLEEIEAAMAKGVRRDQILATLRKHGFSFSMEGFQSALRIQRKKRAEQTTSSTSKRKTR